MLLFRPPVLCFGRRGVKPADFAALGTDPSPLDNDADLPTDAGSEWLWTLLTPLPSSGTTDVNDEGGYALTGAADGVYTQDYRGLVMPATGSVVVYESSITVTVGAGTVGLAVETDTAFALSAVQIAAAGMAAETDTALALAAIQRAAVGLSVETDSAFALDAASTTGPGIAIETDSALALAGVQRGPVGLAVETDVAYALAAGSTGGGTGATAAEIWAHVMANGQTAEANVLAILAALGNLDVKRMNGAPVIGDGTEGNLWRGVGVLP